jgi:uncharacterized protein YdeI (YjbR/CyaY-like superfamily)
MNPEVNWFFTKKSKWQTAYAELRMLVLDCGLTETLKWGCPCYTHDDNNILLIHGFKDYCALLFMQGALLKDTEGILVQQTQNVQAARQLRFANLQEIEKSKATILAYIQESIEIDKAGRKMELKNTSEFNMPEEFQLVLDEMPELKTAFEALTPGRQRGYLLYFSAAKQSKTRTARIEKYLQQILDGKGLED